MRCANSCITAHFSAFVSVHLHTHVVRTCSSGFRNTGCCQNSFVILPRCFKPVEHAWRHRRVLDLFASSSSLGFCLIRLQHHTDIFRVHRHRDKPQRESEMSAPPQRSHRYHAAASTLCFHTCILKRFRTSQICQHRESD